MELNTKPEIYIKEDNPTGTVPTSASMTTRIIKKVKEWWG